MSVTLDPALAAETGIPARVIAAIAQVESRGNPSAVRFEPHVFWRIVLGLPESMTGAQIAARLTPAQQAQVPYTPGPTRAASAIASETNAAAVTRAMAVNANATVRATSWGMYQNLGSNLLAVTGQPPAQAVASFRADPAGVSRRLFAQWVSEASRAPGGPTASAAQKARHDFVANANALDFNLVAKAYNGCGDCTLYSGKLHEAYNATAGGGGGIVATFLGIGALVAAWKWLG